jgi:hypothetical protein
MALCLIGLMIRTGYELLKEAGRVNPRSKGVFFPVAVHWASLIALVTGLGLAVGGKQGISRGRVGLRLNRSGDAHEHTRASDPEPPSPPGFSAWLVPSFHCGARGSLETSGEERWWEQ